MKQAITVLDLSNEYVSLFAQKIDVLFTSTGHYCINIKDGSNPPNPFGQNDYSNREIMVTDSKLLSDKKKDFGFKTHV